MKPTYLFSVFVTTALLSCSTDDPDLSECSAADRQRTSEFRLSALEQEPGGTDSIHVMTTEVTLIRQSVTEEGKTYLTETIYALLDDMYSVTLQLVYDQNGQSTGNGFVSYEITISTTDTTMGTGEEINGNLYHGEGMADNVVSLDCLSSGVIFGNIDQVSPEDEHGTIQYEIEYTAVND